MSEDLQPPVDDVTGQAPVDPVTPSMDDTMQAVMADIEARETETPEAQAARARDESGRFTKTDAPAAPKAAAPVDPKAPTAPAAAPGEFVDRGPPTTWRAGAKARWNDVPPELKAEVYKREQDAFNGIQQYHGKAQVADALMGAIQPYRPIIDALGTDIPGALNEVLRTAAIFHVGTPEQKAATLRTLAQRHGVDIGAAVNNGQDQFRDPALEAANERIARLEATLAGQAAASQNSELMQAQGEINAFANDPAKKYFREVSHTMGVLIQGAGLQGRQLSMQDAYDQACHADPTIRAALQVERDSQAAQERNQRAAAARRAGDLSVRSVPTPRPVASPTKGWQDAIEDYHAAIVSRDAA